MTWVCGVLSFMWFCPGANFTPEADFEKHLKFFSDLDIVLSVPERVCSSLVGEKKEQFKALAHLKHDERLAEIENIDPVMFNSKVVTCSKDCNCGALMTLEDKVSGGLTDSQSKTLRERQEQLTNSYFESCQKKVQLTCDSKVVLDILETGPQAE